MGLTDRLDAALQEKTTKRRSVDKWLDKHPERRDEFLAGLRHFAEVRSPNTLGFPSLSQLLCEEWDDFPTGKDHLRTWFNEHVDEIMAVPYDGPGDES